MLYIKHFLDLLVVEDIKAKPDALRDIQDKVPILFGLIKALDLKHKSLPDEFKDVVEEMWKKCEAPFLEAPLQPNVNHLIVLDDQLFGFFPCFPVLRLRGNYNMDNTNYDKKVCSKSVNGHPSLLPGSVTMVTWYVLII